MFQIVIGTLTTTVLLIEEFHENIHTIDIPVFIH